MRLVDDLAEPVPSGHDVVVEVRAFAINHDEANLIARRPDGWRPGQDVAGVVVAAAGDGSGPGVGARVVCYLDWEGWAERVVVPSHCVAALDDRVSFEQAASLPVAGLTALRVGGAVLGRQVLVTGASGGVGQFAVQLAVAAGARVTAQVSRSEREAGVRALGAHRVVTSLDADDLGPFHVVLDGIGGAQTAQAIRHMAPGGQLALYGKVAGDTSISISDFYAQGWNAHVIGFVSPVPDETKGEDLGILAELVADGRLTPHIGLVMDWERTAEGFAALERRETTGKIVMRIGA